LLGKLLLYLVPYIKRNKKLEYFNISTNLLGTLDKEFILGGLGVALSKNLENYREQNDVVFHKSFSFFERQHLSSNFSVTKQDPELAKTVKTALAFYDQIINAGILKTMRADRSLIDRLSQNSNTGSIIASTSTK
jgi:hypothetical protein